MTSAAVVVFYDERGKVLLHDRSEITKSDEDWGFIGGGVEVDEDPLAAAEREVREELGLRIDRLSFLKKYKATVDGDPDGEVHVFTSAMPSMSLRHLEGGRLMWVKPDEVLKLRIFPIMPNILADFKRRRPAQQ